MQLKKLVWNGSSIFLPFFSLIQLLECIPYPHISTFFENGQYFCNLDVIYIEILIFYCILLMGLPLPSLHTRIILFKSHHVLKHSQIPFKPYGMILRIVFCFGDIDNCLLKSILPICHFSAFSGSLSKVFIRQIQH